VPMQEPLDRSSKLSTPPPVDHLALTRAPEDIDGVVALLGDEERAVLLVLAKRLLAGQRAYGRLDLANDRRDFRAERGLEIQDLLVYSAIDELAREMRSAR
jgi:hypothetical protein